MSPSLACVTALGLLLLLAGCTATRPARPSTAGSTAVTPQNTVVVAVNDTCPISGLPVDPNVPGVEFAGYTMGLCSPVCTSQWHETPVVIKDHFLTTSLRKRTRRELPQSPAPG